MKKHVPPSVQSHFDASHPQYSKSAQLVDFHAFKYARLFPAVEVRPLQQAGWVALWESRLRFDPSRGVQFLTYANTAVKKAILRELRVEHNRAMADVMALPDDQVPLEPFDDRALVNADTKCIVDEFLGTLSTQQRRVAEMVRDDVRPVDIAADLDLSRARISMILARVRVLAGVTLAPALA